MGNSSSKVARRLPTKPMPSWAGARTGSIPQHSRSEAMKEMKEQEKQPKELLEKLRQLGPVNVDHHMTTIRTDTRMQHLLKSREISEQQAASSQPTKNRILAGDLHSLLTDRKSVMSTQEMESLAERFTMDVDVLERLSRVVNSPSIDPRSRKYVKEEGGSERLIMTACWEDPLITQQITSPKSTPNSQ